VEKSIKIGDFVTAKRNIKLYSGKWYKNERYRILDINDMDIYVESPDSPTTSTLIYGCKYALFTMKRGAPYRPSLKTNFYLETQLRKKKLKKLNDHGNIDI